MDKFKKDLKDFSKKWNTPESKVLELLINVSRTNGSNSVCSEVK